MGTLGVKRGIALLLACVVLGAVSALLWKKSQEDQRVQLGLTNLRRLGIGLLLYAQDWDSCPMPLRLPTPDKGVKTWADFLAPYIESDDIENPLNPVLPNTKHPKEGFLVRSGYAFNTRFWDTFGKGAFPLSNLELPAQTALFVEAGSAWRDPLHPPRSSEEVRPLALTEYTDMTERIEGFSPFPSARTGKTAIVAADGHIVTVKVDHYTPDPLHDTLYGRIGGNLYNWNGGFPLGKTDGRPRN